MCIATPVRSPFFNVETFCRHTATCIGSLTNVFTVADLTFQILLNYCGLSQFLAIFFTTVVLCNENKNKVVLSRFCRITYFRAYFSEHSCTTDRGFIHSLVSYGIECRFTHWQSSFLWPSEHSLGLVRVLVEVQITQTLWHHLNGFGIAGQSLNVK